MRTSECREIPELQTLSSLHCPQTLHDAIAQPETWRSALSHLERRRPGDHVMLAEYRSMLDSGAIDHLIDAVLDGRHQVTPPARHSINKAHAHRKKVIFRLNRRDEFLMRVLNHVLQPAVDAELSPRCHSFRAGHSAHSAFQSIMRHDPGELFTVHLDIADFFNSINVEGLLAGLPQIVRDDRTVMAVLEPFLRSPIVCDDGRLVAIEHKGVMAGTPLAPLLTNLYLRDLDRRIVDSGVVSARYSDDFIVLGDARAVERAETLIRDDLASRGLMINEEKTRRTAPGEAWDFLGLRYDRGEIGLSENTVAKLRAKVRRRARNLDRYRTATGRTGSDICRLFARTLNRKLYGVGARGENTFCWSAWFFPVITTTDQLRPLDAFIQEQVRYAATGTRRVRARKILPYVTLRESGYIPLITAYHARRSNRGAAIGRRAEVAS